MVAKIVTGKSIRGILHYNEHKVAAGEAKLILASGFAADIERVNFKQKLARFENLNLLRPTVKTNALHITLNFDASEKLDNSKIQQIAMAYMDKIGFGDQPYLVYRHDDVAHQHIHIATTSIQRDGKAINLNYIGQDKSESARKAIEKEFNLVVAESKTYKQQPGIKCADPEKALYGHLPTKRAMSNVISAVMSQYHYISLAEFNAVLKQFNVIAERGAEDSLMFQKKGLIYSLLDKQRNKVGIPIKASAFYIKPTLANLEKKFARNLEKRQQYKEPLKKTIEQVFSHYSSLTRQSFVAEMQKQNISVLFRSNDKGFIYGATFIDHRHKTVFNGSDLGKNYGAKGLQARFGTTDRIKQVQATITKTKEQQHQEHLKPEQPVQYLKLAMAQYQPGIAPAAPRKKKKKGLDQDQELNI
ncbi:MAG TPA: relaxase/mobilization nuclease domain-containing protein [Mucilaginibacter sp.]